MPYWALSSDLINLETSLYILLLSLILPVSFNDLKKCHESNIWWDGISSSLFIYYKTGIIVWSWSVMIVSGYFSMCVKNQRNISLMSGFVDLAVIAQAKITVLPWLLIPAKNPSKYSLSYITSPLSYKRRGLSLNRENVKSKLTDLPNFSKFYFIYWLVIKSRRGKRCLTGVG